MSNIIDSIQLSGTVYTIQGSGGGSGNPTVEVTQAEYDALVSAGTVSANTYYIITDASPQDMSNYWTSAQTQSAITQATSVKVDTSSVVSSVTSASTDSEIPTAKAVWEAASGGGGSITIDQSLDSGSTNPVANSAITNNTLSGGVETNNFFRSVRFRRNNGEVAFYKRFAAINGNSVMVDGTTEAPNFQLVETSAITSSVTSTSTDDEIPTAKAVYDKLSEKADTSAVTESITEATSGKLDTSTFETYSGATATEIGNKLATSDFNTYSGTVDTAINSKASESDLSGLTDVVSAHTANTTIHVTTAQTAAWDAKQNALTIDSTVTSGSTNPVQGGAVYTQLGGLKLVKLTQSAYDALSPDYDANTLYVIVN